jgi:NhaC family Na+:H+ antiporter
LASLAFPLFQPELVKEVAGEATGEGFLQGFRGVLIAVFGATSIDAGGETVNALISTRGMSGMMNTVWLILCAMSFGGVMTGSGMLAALTNRFVSWVHRPRMAVSATVGAGLFFNLATADQYISIILTGRLFRELYRRLGLEERLLSRTVEDSATVTSVLIPWNSCGMTQATVLGVATFTYLPYCIFNYLSPIFSILVALIGYKIYRRHE